MEKHDTSTGKCTYEGLSYVERTGLCVSGKCMVCEGGRWVEDETVLQSPPTS